MSMSTTAGVVELRTSLRAEKHEATKEWIEKQKIQPIDVAEDELEDIESIAESSIVDSSDNDYLTDTESDQDDDTVTTKSLGTQIASSNEIGLITQNIKELFNSINSVQTVGNVKIENSTGVHIGNITNINGNIQIIHAGESFQARKSSNSNSAQKSTTAGAQRADQRNAKTRMPSKPPEEEREERNRNDAFLDSMKFKIPKKLCTIVPRRSWLAQRPLEKYDYLEEPVKYVVISHTATESSEKQAINTGLIRDIQCLHIEARGWNDIAYNFLVGCDGNVYEGRSWGVVGAHTMGYNTRAIGISFIGCFMRVLPTSKAFNACKNLLKRGVDEGHLAADYKLICHCQCCATESPGRKLFEEIQKWDHFYNNDEDEEE